MRCLQCRERLRQRLPHQPWADPTDLTDPTDRSDRSPPPAQCRRAYTLLEMLMVLFIVGLLVTVVVGLYQHSQDAANRRRALADLGTLHQAIDAFYLEFGRYPVIPETANEGNAASEPPAFALLDLETARATLEAAPWPEPPGDWFVRRLPEGFTGIDPWRNPYQYEHDVDPTDANADVYRLYSLGPDGQEKDYDDDGAIRFQP